MEQVRLRLGKADRVLRDIQGLITDLQIWEAGDTVQERLVCDESIDLFVCQGDKSFSMRRKCLTCCRRIFLFDGKLRIRTLDITQFSLRKGFTFPHYQPLRCAGVALGKGDSFSSVGSWGKTRDDQVNRRLGKQRLFRNLASSPMEGFAIRRSGC